MEPLVVDAEKSAVGLPGASAVLTALTGARTRWSGPRSVLCYPRQTGPLKTSQDREHVAIRRAGLQRQSARSFGTDFSSELV